MDGMSSISKAEMNWSGRTVELEITDLNHAGEGVGRAGSFTVFVPFCVPGDRVSARVISVQKNYARALLETLLVPSPLRVKAPCRHFGACGGCQLQHLGYGEQLRQKREIVLQALRRLGGLETAVLPVLGMAEPWHYRNKAQFPLAREGGKLRAGFFRRGTHQIVDLLDCPIQHPLIDSTFTIARNLLDRMGVPVYDEKTHSGLLRHLAIRVSDFANKVLVIFVTNGRDFPQGSALAKALSAGVPALAGVVQNVNTRRGNIVFGVENITLWGEPCLIEQVGGISCYISPASFFQVNSLQAGVLFRQVEKYAALTGTETVFDLYCGTGTIALYLSRRAGKVIGIESFAAAISDARENARLNRINNAEFFTGKAEELFPGFVEKGYRPDVVIVDPPRKGCSEKLLSAIATAGPKRLIYVSCNPSTLARDLRYLLGKGYDASEVQPIDMFPQTSHVETVVLMSRVDK